MEDGATIGAADLRTGKAKKKEEEIGAVMGEAWSASKRGWRVSRWGVVPQLEASERVDNRASRPT